MTDIGTRLREASRSVAPEQPAFERLVWRRDRRARNRRIASAVVALAVVGGVLGVTLSALGGLFAGDRAGIRPGDDPSWTTDPDLRIGPGDYLYERTVHVYPDGVDGSPAGASETEFWWGGDGSGRRVFQSDMDSSPGRISRVWGPGESPFYDPKVSELSTDPETLRAQLAARGAPGGASPQPNATPGIEMTPDSGRVWRAVEALLETPAVFPELRAALFSVATELEGVEVRRNEVDAVGRRAVVAEITLPHEGGTIQLFFDPETLQPMGKRELYPEGTWHRIVVEAGIVRSTDETPTAEERFFPRPGSPLPKP